MIIKMNYEEKGIKEVRTNEQGVFKNHYIRFIVDEYSLENAIKQTKGNKWVVALDYEGELGHLKNIEELPSVPLIVTKEIDHVTDVEIGFILMQLPKWVRLAIKTPKNFNDMRLVKELSLKYPNVRFCGGDFLRLPGCNIGCIDREDLPSKVVESKVSYYTSCCSCIKRTMHIEDVEGVDVVYGDKQITQAEKKKRVVSNLHDLLCL